MANLIRSALLLVLSIVLISFNASAAATLEVTSPIDKTNTLSTRTDINGTAPEAKQLELNETKVSLEGEGKFNAVALLNPGKNLIMISALYPNGEKLTNKFRILRTITCDDMEMLYKERDHWAKQQVLTLLTIGIVEGYPDNMFEPGNFLSRSEFATWVARARQLEISQPTEDVFFDVPKEHWRAPYIKAVVDAGYMSGLTPDRFGINEKINRSDAVVIVAKAYHLSPLMLSTSPFYDVPIDSRDSAYIYSAFNKGWVVGYPGKIRRFEPDKEMTRAEMTVFLSRLSNIKELETSLFDFEEGYTSNKFCNISTKPVISKIIADPIRLAADGKTPLKIAAEVTDAQGKSDISQVWADITSLNGPNNAKMNLMQSGMYEITFILTTETVPGEKNITVRASDKSGLKSEISNVKVFVTK